MKRFIEQAKRHAVALEQLLDVRMNALVRPAARPLEPLEIRNAVLREIEAQVIPGPNGARVFPFNDILVEWRGRSVVQDAALEATLDGLENAARQCLRGRQAAMPKDVTLRVVRVVPAPVDWPPDLLYRVTLHRVAAARGRSLDENSVALVLTLRGMSDATTFRLTHGRMDIGRTADVRDRRGRLVRRNAVVIAEAYDPDGTVSRRHAHVTAAADADGRRIFVVYDDASRYGTRIVRDGETVAVHPGTLGVRLRDGDELHVGDVVAAVRLES